MRGFVTAVSLVAVLGTAPAFAQQPAVRPPAEPQSVPVTPPPQPPAPLPQDAKYAYVDLSRVAAESTAGRASNAKLQALAKQKQDEVAQKQKALQASQQKLQTGAGVLSAQAAADLQRDIDRQNLELQRFQEDSQNEINEMTQQLQLDFNQRLLPIIDQIGKEKNLYMIFSASDAGIVWAHPGLDLSAEVIQRLDAAAQSSAAKPAPTAAKPAQPAGKP
jgi:outer membrane protein